MRKKVRQTTVIFALALLVVVILWLTLFSRLGSESRHFYPPFWSYRAIAEGSGETLLEIVGNIALFLPIGAIASLILNLNLLQTVFFSFGLSLVIESCQWFLWLGSFEIDDLLHNTLGGLIGSALMRRTEPFQERRKNALVLAALITFMILIGFGYRDMKIQTMVRFAAMNDKADGTRNLLVLSPDPKYIGQTDFRISYNDDGSVLIEGKSEERAWIEIGRFELPAGAYSFSGLSGVPEKTVALELEYYDTEQGKFYRLTEDVGPINEVEFKLEDKTKLRALVRLYAGVEGKYLARPAIYGEDIR